MKPELTPTIGHYVTVHFPVANLVGQPLKVLRQVGVFIAVRDDLNALVQHVISKLFEFAHVLSPHQHEMLKVGLVFDRLEKQCLESGVVHCPTTAQEHKRLGFVEFLDLPLQKQYYN